MSWCLSVPTGGDHAGREEEWGYIELRYKDKGELKVIPKTTID